MHRVDSDIEEFRKWYLATLDEQVESEHVGGDLRYSDYAAIGDRAWITKLRKRIGIRTRQVIFPRTGATAIPDDRDTSYGLKVPTRERSGMVVDLAGGSP